MIAVSDTSPLILLEKASCLWVLEKLFKTVIIPPAVDKEWYRPSKNISQWLSIGTLSDKAVAIAEELYQKMDKGESEAIALFSTMKADWLLLDDLKGRKYALFQGFPVIGTVGILIKSKNKGFIPKLRPILEFLKTQKFYISDDIFIKALIIVNE